MANHFDQDLWQAIGKRLKEFIPKTTNEIDDFAFQHGLRGVRLDRVANGVKGTSVESLVQICEAADINPTYLLFGKGRKRLSETMPT